MAAQGSTLDEIVETLHRKLPLNDYGGVRLDNKVHVAIRLGTLKLGLCKSPDTRKDQIVPYRLDLYSIRQRIQISHNLLEIGGGQIDDSGVLYIGNHQLLRVGLNESQLVVVGLTNILVVEFHAEVGNNAILVILLVNVHGKRVVVRESRY